MNDADTNSTARALRPACPRIDYEGSVSRELPSVKCAKSRLRQRLLVGLAEGLLIRLASEPRKGQAVCESVTSVRSEGEGKEGREKGWVSRSVTVRMVR